MANSKLKIRRLALQQKPGTGHLTAECDLVFVQQQCAITWLT